MFVHAIPGARGTLFLDRCAEHGLDPYSVPLDDPLLGKTTLQSSSLFARPSIANGEDRDQTDRDPPIRLSVPIPSKPKSSPEPADPRRAALAAPIALLKRVMPEVAECSVNIVFYDEAPQWMVDRLPKSSMAVMFTTGRRESSETVSMYLDWDAHVDSGELHGHLAGSILHEAMHRLEYNHNSNFARGMLHLRSRAAALGTHLSYAHCGMAQCPMAAWSSWEDADEALRAEQTFLWGKPIWEVLEQPMPPRFLAALGIPY